MSEDTTTDATTDTSATDATDWKAEAEKWQALSRKNEERAKNNVNAVKELERLKAQSMTETEKAVAEAEKRGRTGALVESGTRLARAEIRAAAGGRVDPSTLDSFLEFADLRKFVGDDGEPDTKAITAAVKKLGGSERATDFDGGARTSAGNSGDMNQLIRDLSGHGRR